MTQPVMDSSEYARRLDALRRLSRNEGPSWDNMVNKWASELKEAWEMAQIEVAQGNLSKLQTQHKTGKTQMTDTKTLETKIDQLTATITLLNETLNKMGALTVPVPAATEPTPVTSDASQDVLDYDDVKQRCLSIVREDRTKKAAIKALLQDYGVKVVNKLTVEQLFEFNEKLGEL